jgi:hypothetical protein
MIQVNKLKFTDKDQALKTLIDKGVIDEQGKYINGTHAVVYIGVIVDQQGTYDEEGNELTPATFIDGYHVDVMTDDAINFGELEVFPNNEVHKFI